MSHFSDCMSDEEFAIYIASLAETSDSSGERPFYVESTEQFLQTEYGGNGVKFRTMSKKDLKGDIINVRGDGHCFIYAFVCALIYEYGYNEFKKLMKEIDFLVPDFPKDGIDLCDKIVAYMNNFKGSMKGLAGKIREIIIPILEKKNIHIPVKNFLDENAIGPEARQAICELFNFNIEVIQLEDQRIDEKLFYLTYTDRRKTLRIITKNGCHFRAYCCPY